MSYLFILTPCEKKTKNSKFFLKQEFREFSKSSKPSKYFSHLGSILCRTHRSSIVFEMPPVKKRTLESKQKTRLKKMKNRMYIKFGFLAELMIEYEIKRNGAYYGL